uniref:Transposase n=1 Tax=Heterorhabditis bacteriophora TaxID=37862 RepID=A0A1I7X6M5_HETBA
MREYCGLKTSKSLMSDTNRTYLATLSAKMIYSEYDDKSEGQIHLKRQASR